jgi:prefoldin alpha subunit
MISNSDGAKQTALPQQNVQQVKEMIIKELCDLKSKINEIQAGKLEITTQVDKELFISSTVMNKDEILIALGCGIFVEMSAAEALKFIDERLEELNKP